MKDIWPSAEEIEQTIKEFINPEMFKNRYMHILEDNPMWQTIHANKGAIYPWDSNSTYIQNPPYFEKFDLQLPPYPKLLNMRALAIFGDSVTTDHISPAGAFKSDSPAGKYLLSLGVKEEDFNSYGSRRGNHHIMIRGTFANVRMRNKMVDSKEGGYTRLMPENSVMTIFDACQEYHKRKVPLLVIAGKDYGMGSSRDWAAKGPALLGVKLVIAQSFERIHRSNLIGMGILPLQFLDQENADSLQITGNEIFSLEGITEELRPQQEVTLVIEHLDGLIQRQKLISRLDTALEVEYYRQGGILPFVMRQLINL